MQVPTGTPRKPITIAEQPGMLVYQPFVAGHKLSETEALVLNQTLAENIRNNTTKLVKEALKEGKDAQKVVDEYFATYEFGQRRGGGAKPADPIDAEALRLATDLAKTQIVKRGDKLKDFKAADVRKEAEKLLERYPQIRKKAEKNVKDDQALEADVLKGL